MTLTDLILLAIGIIIILSLRKQFNLIVKLSEQLDYMREILLSIRDNTYQTRDLLKKPPEREQGK